MAKFQLTTGVSQDLWEEEAEPNGGSDELPEANCHLEVASGRRGSGNGTSPGGRMAAEIWVVPAAEARKVEGASRTALLIPRPQ